MFGPVFERVPEKHPDIVFGKVDTEAQPQIARAFHVRSIPTLVALRGAMPESMLDQLIATLRTVQPNSRELGRVG